MTLLTPSSRLSTPSSSQSPPSRIPRSPALYRLPPRPRTTIFSSPKARPKIPGVITSPPSSKPKPKVEPRLRALVLVEKYHPPPSDSESKPPFRVTALRERKGKENGSRIPRTTRLSAPLPPLKPKESPLKPKASPIKSVKSSVSTVRIKAKVHRPRQSITTGMRGLSMSMRRNKGKRPAIVVPPIEKKVEQEPVEQAIKVAEPTADRSPSPARSLSQIPVLSPSLSSPSSSVFSRSPTASQPSSPITTESVTSDFSLPASPSIVSSPPTSTTIASLNDVNPTPRPPRRKIIIPPFLDTQSGPKDAKIRGELERLRAKKKVQSAAADATLIQ